MKKPFLQLSTLLLATILVVPAFAQNAAKPGSKEGTASSEVTWTRGESRELANLRVELDVVRQRDSNGPGVAELQHRIAAVEKQQPWLLSFDFSGGTMKKFLAVFAKVSDVSVSIISNEPDGLAEAQLPPFSLRNASVQTIINVLGQLLEGRGYYLKYVGDSGQTNTAVCVLIKQAEARKEDESRPAQFESFPVGQYLSEQSIDDIVGAIRAGWELDPSHNKDALKLKFHQPTAILLVSGPAEATHIAGKIISQLKRPPAKIVKVNAQGEPLPETKK